MRSNKKNILLFLSLAILLAIFISPFASSNPDGLEWVAKTKGFLVKAEDNIFWKNSLMPDYSIPQFTFLSKTIAGLIGTLLTFIFTMLLLKLKISKKFYTKKNN
ncbi:MAG: PDGLE domain-containing protein [Oligoflexia bacterium]|nr:PDGLE domain-containing protein [Oligoflexia bacterium]